MKPIDYLRAMTRRQKPATGGFVPYEPRSLVQLGGGCVFPAALPQQPSANLTIQLRTPIPEDARRIADALRMPIRSGPGPASLERAARETGATTGETTLFGIVDSPRCPCGVIYSRCYYPLIHAARQR